MCHRPNVRSPRFRRDPFVRDVVFDHGRAAGSRITGPHMLPSTLLTVSASAEFWFSRLNSTPHTITVYASHPPSPATTQHSLPGARYGLPGPVSHRRDHASLTWRTSNPAFFGLRIASQSLSSGARSRDPLARNDSNFGNTAQTFGAIAFATISPALAAIASRPHPRTRRRPRPPSSSA
jgi:hypothetical protein